MLVAMRSRGLAVGATLVAMWCAISVIGPHLVRDPLAVEIEHGLTAAGAPLPDGLGRDVLARVVAGAGTSLLLAALATAGALVLGIAIGVTAGYVGGWVDTLAMRAVDAALAFPALLLALLLAALLHATSLAGGGAVVVALALIGWTTIARVMRGKAMLLTRSSHVLAARALGASPARVLIRNVLPHVGGLAAALASIAFAQNLIAEAMLSYVGLGVAPPAPTWGRMVFEGRAYYRTAPWLIVAPGAAIVLAVLAFQLLGDGLRARLTPERAP
jgi:peptide/nickel transport system permease protein